MKLFVISSRWSRWHSPPRASAQFVKGNEAVKVMPDGTKKVETPPLPATGPIRSTKPCAATPTTATAAPG
jgi:hypothetical protein